MIDIENIFKNRQPDGEKLLQSGFARTGEGYKSDFPILQGQFTLTVFIAADGRVDYRVYDAQTAEEYFLARVPDATGAFIGEVHAACEAIFSELARTCFPTAVFQNPQTGRVLLYIKERYGAEPEFLWERFPEFAAMRTPKKVWFALLGKVPKRKFGLSEEGDAEIVNLKAEPETVESRIRSRLAYPAYHMNKRCWYSTFLDDSLPDGELFSLIDRSVLSIR